jgi:hypothetical protein
MIDDLAQASHAGAGDDEAADLAGRPSALARVRLGLWLRLTSRRNVSVTVGRCRWPIAGIPRTRHRAA